MRKKILTLFFMASAILALCLHSLPVSASTESAMMIAADGDNAQLRQRVDSLLQVAVKDSALSISLPYKGEARQWILKASETNLSDEELSEVATELEKFIATVENARDMLNLITDRRNDLNDSLPADYPDRSAVLLGISRMRRELRRNGESDSLTFAGVISYIDSIASYIAPLHELQLEISAVLTQLNATNYPGSDELRSHLLKAYDVRRNFSSVEQIRQATLDLTDALPVYLATRPSEWVTIKNGNLWKTDLGATVQAHAPGFVRVGDIWYMCGEDRSNSWNPDVNLYSSVDLVHWRFENKIIRNGVTSPLLGSSRFIERPKLLYNAKTGKYVVWCHWEQSNYGASEAACFECDSVNGNYKLVWSGRPLNVKSRDCNVFQNDNGKAYFISTTNENTDLGLFELSDDYLSIKSHTALFTGWRREAPAIVKVNGRFFMFNSACSGWDPNQCKMANTLNLKTNWSTLNNVGNSNAYDTQAAAFLTIKGTKATTYLYVGDRWQDPDLPNTKTIIFPIEFNGKSCTFRYHERFDINFVTGEWRETPVNTVFADKSGWKVIDYSSQQPGNDAYKVIDGSTSTFWHTQYSYSVAPAPHYITIDMGSSQTIKGFLSTPRMDGSTNGLIRNYKFQVSDDNKKWSTVSSGSWLPYCTEVDFSPRTCRYIKLVCTEGTYASMAELDVVKVNDSATGIEGVKADVDSNGEKQIKDVHYYSLTGQRLSSPDKGIYIETTTFSDGTQKSVKKLRK